MYISGKYLDYDKKLNEAQSRIASLSAKNESLTIQISTLTEVVKKGKDRLKTLEENIDTDKASSKLKDKQIDEALMKVDKAGFEAVEKFKASDKFSDKLCDYYVDGFELFHKYLAKHHLEMEDIISLFFWHSFFFFYLNNLLNNLFSSSILSA